MDLTGEMKKSRVELLKQKQKVEKMLRGVEAYLEEVGISFDGSAVQGGHVRLTTGGCHWGGSFTGSAA